MLETDTRCLSHRVTSGKMPQAEPIAYMVDHIRGKQPLDGPSALDLNLQVNQVLEAAKISVRTGRAVPLPLKEK